MDMSGLRVGAPVMGLVGLGCLEHYCIQLDFLHRKMRFLDPDHPGGKALGTAFPLSSTFISFGRLFAVRENLVGIDGVGSVIDTGCTFDGVLTPKLFRNWIGGQSLPSRASAHFPDGNLGGNHYTHLYLHGDGTFNSLGQLFLARHLVTLNFPKRIMYLRQLSPRSLADGSDFFDGFYPKSDGEHRQTFRDAQH